jgi:hypothetical protein
MNTIFCYFAIEPEVAGGFGDSTEMDHTKSPPEVLRLEYRMDGWLGDPILETFPCYIITEETAEELRIKGLSGFYFDDVAVTFSETFTEVYPDKAVPNFKWMKITGKPGIDDAFISIDNILVISKDLLEILQSYGMKNADVEEHHDS